MRFHGDEELHSRGVISPIIRVKRVFSNAAASPSGAREEAPGVCRKVSSSAAPGAGPGFDARGVKKMGLTELATALL
jgi:hypothetical protein